LNIPEGVQQSCGEVGEKEKPQRIVEVEQKAKFVRHRQQIVRAAIRRITMILRRQQCTLAAKMLARMRRAAEADRLVTMWNQMKAKALRPLNGNPKDSRDASADRKALGRGMAVIGSQASYQSRAVRALLRLDAGWRRAEVQLVLLSWRRSFETHMIHKVQQHAEAAIATSVSKYTHMQLTAQSRGAGVMLLLKWRGRAVTALALRSALHRLWQHRYLQRQAHSCLDVGQQSALHHTAADKHTMWHHHVQDWGSAVNWQPFDEVRSHPVLTSIALPPSCGGPSNRKAMQLLASANQSTAPGFVSTSLSSVTDAI